jgi:hypothetical protein
MASDGERLLTLSWCLGPDHVQPNEERAEESSDGKIQMRERLQGRGWMDACRVKEKIKVVTYFCIWIYN